MCTAGHAACRRPAGRSTRSCDLGCGGLSEHSGRFRAGQEQRAPTRMDAGLLVCTDHGRLPGRLQWLHGWRDGARDETGTGASRDAFSPVASGPAYSCSAASRHRAAGVAFTLAAADSDSRPDQGACGAPDGGDTRCDRRAATVAPSIAPLKFPRARVADHGFCPGHMPLYRAGSRQRAGSVSQAPGTLSRCLSRRQARSASTTISATSDMKSTVSAASSRRLKI